MSIRDVRLRADLLVTYLVLAVITGWLSFASRPGKINEAVALQQTVWHNLGERGTSSGRGPDEYLIRVHSSRILFPALMQVPITLGLSEDQSFSFLRLITIAVAFVVFHVFLRQWFSDELAFCGTLFLAATVGLTFNNRFEIPTDFLEIIVFTFGVWLIYRKKYWWLGLTVLLGTLNRETTAVLVIFLFFSLCDFKKDWLLPVAATALCWAVPLVALRWWTGTLGEHGSLGMDTVTSTAGPEALSHNLEGFSRLLNHPHPYNHYLFWFYLFGAFWLLPFMRWQRQPPFYKRLLLSLPVCVVAYVFVGAFLNEPRLIVNLYPLLVPASLFALFPGASSKAPQPLAA